MEVKTCSKCHEELPLSSFHRNSRRLDGFHIHCKNCRSSKNTSQETPKDGFKRCCKCKEELPLENF